MNKIMELADNYARETHPRLITEARAALAAEVEKLEAESNEMALIGVRSVADVLALREKLEALSQPVSMEPVAYLAWRDGKPCYEGDDAVCEDAVWPVDSDDDRESMPVYTVTQLSAARQQGVDGSNQEKWTRRYQEVLDQNNDLKQRIVELEKSNAVLLEALKDWLNWSAEDGIDSLRAIEAQARAAVKEVKP